MHKVNQDTYAKVIKALLTDPYTAHELVEISGLHIVTMQHLMRCFHKNKVVYICGWETDTMGRDSTPVYKLGVGRAVPRRRMTTAERTARYRAKKQTIEAAWQGTLNAQAG